MRQLPLFDFPDILFSVEVQCGYNVYEQQVWAQSFADAEEVALEFYPESVDTYVIWVEVVEAESVCQKNFYKNGSLV